ncbi:MAG: hypothetical protein ACRDGR_03350, partial [bacterium]
MRALSKAGAPAVAVLLVLLFIVFVLAGAASAQGEAAVPPPAPPQNVRAEDSPNDRGGALVVKWEASPDEARQGVTTYRILRS